MTGIPTQCTVCGEPLRNQHALVTLCAECKLIARNERLSAPAHSTAYTEQTIKADADKASTYLPASRTTPPDQHTDHGSDERQTAT
jgi:hypothetical protein